MKYKYKDIVTHPTFKDQPRNIRIIIWQLSVNQISVPSDLLQLHLDIYEAIVQIFGRSQALIPTHIFESITKSLSRDTMDYIFSINYHQSCSHSKISNL